MTASTGVNEFTHKTITHCQIIYVQALLFAIYARIKIAIGCFCTFLRFSIVTLICSIRHPIWFRWNAHAVFFFSLPLFFPIFFSYAQTFSNRQLNFEENKVFSKEVCTCHFDMKFPNPARDHFQFHFCHK